MRSSVLVVVLFCILAALTSASVVSRKERSPRDKESDEISSKFLQEARRLRKRTLGGLSGEGADGKAGGIFESFNTIIAAAMDMIRNLITIKQNIVIPLSTAAVRTVDTLVNSELTQTVIDTKVNLARTALSVGPRLLDTAVTIAQRKAAVFQLAVCKLFCPLTGGTPEGVAECQAQHCKQEDREGKEGSAEAKTDFIDAEVDDSGEDEEDVEVDSDEDSREKRKTKAELKSIESEIDADEKELKRKLLKWKKIMAELEEEE